MARDRNTKASWCASWSYDNSIVIFFRSEPVQHPSVEPSFTNSLSRPTSGGSLLRLCSWRSGGLAEDVLHAIFRLVGQPARAPRAEWRILDLLGRGSEANDLFPLPISGSTVRVFSGWFDFLWMAVLIVAACQAR